MPRDARVALRPARIADLTFIVEMARHACVIEDWPLPDREDPEVLGMLPQLGEVPLIAHDCPSRVPLGAVWTWHNNPPLQIDREGSSVPELCIAVVPDRRGAGIGGLLLDALFVEKARTLDEMCINVHIRNPARRLYERKGFSPVGQGRGPRGLAMVKDLRGPA